ncbi:spermine oxidase-like isoform X2 [Hyposmocoma kahamanoa]|uniref:spermine oxidase-like isoform X2 n=1 Tax=Hyposmocoma kahamanoa TaxID=1477025 RepID=UPI000E6D657A|nr:spermine oxidase-like isoform X2 [Hyposmocoma kahamanoa]
MARSHYETIVIGLGAAGVTAATTLAKAGRVVLGIEAQGRVGGRVNTVLFGNGVVEVGAEWIHGESSNRVYDVALQIKIPMGLQSAELNVFRSDGQLPNKEFQAIVNEILAKGMDLMEDVPHKSEPFGHYAVRKLREYIQENHPELLNDEDLIDQLIELFELFSNNHSASNNWNDLDSRDRYTPVDGHQYISWHKHGFKTFFEVMLNTYNNGPGLPTLDIKLDTEVIQIYWPEHPNEKVTVTTKDGSVVTADNVIITVSLGVLKESYKTLFSPRLPASKVTAIENMSIGVMDKIIISFQHSWWPKNVTFFGFLWRGEDRRKIGREDYWITRIYGATTPMGSNNALTLWTSGEVAKMVELLPEDLVKRKCVQLLQMFMGGNITIPEPTGIIREISVVNEQ